jgi:hypothetical protein
VLSPATKAPPMSSKCVASFSGQNTSNGFRIVFSEISNVVVWNQTFQKPHKFNVAIAFFLKVLEERMIE